MNEQVSNFYCLCDWNSDGALSYEEFNSKVCWGYQLWEIATTLNETVFNSIDTDNDGLIEGSEISGLEYYYNCDPHKSHRLGHFVNITYCSDCDEDGVADSSYGDLSDVVCPITTKGINFFMKQEVPGLLAFRVI